MYLRIQFHQCWLWKRKFLCGCTFAKRDQEMWDAYELGTKFITSRTLLYSTGYAEWKTVFHILYICLLILSQSWPTFKKIAAINLTLLNETDVYNFPQKCLFTLTIVTVCINVWMKLVVYIYQTFRHGNVELPSGKGCWLFHEIIISIKNFLISKEDNYFLNVWCEQSFY